MNARHIVTSLSIFALAMGGILATMPSVSAGGCYMPRVSMGGTAEPSTAVYMRSMPCMEEGERLSIVRPGEVLKIMEFSDNWYKLKRDNGEIGRVYKVNWLTNINAYETDGTTTTETKPTTTTTTTVRQPMLNNLKLIVAIRNIKKNYSAEQIDSLVEHFQALKTKSSDLSFMAEFMIKMLTK